MSNRLPEKLAGLRKEYGFTQSDVAQKLNISVTEYMNWENGNTICSIEQLKILADTYNVSLDDLVDNTKEIRRKQEPETTTINIPFMVNSSSNSANIADTEDIVRPYSDTVPTQELTEGTIRVDLNGLNQAGSASGQTLTQTFTQSMTIRPKQEEEDDDTEPGPRKGHAILIAVALALIATAVFVGILLFGRRNTPVSVSQVNRIALGDKYSLYIDKNRSLQVRGVFEPASEFKNVVQVSAYDSHALGLTENGTVVNSVSDAATETWKNVVMIAAGKNHSAAVRKDGTVYCSGSGAACRVSEWKDVEQIAAGDEVTIAVHKDGTVSASGSVPAGIADLRDVRAVSIGRNTYAFILKDGKVKVFPSGSERAAEAAVWTHVDEIAAGNNTVAGILKDGRAVISAADEDVKERVLSWGDLRYIAANGETIVAVDKNGKMHGAGDNTYNQYDETEESPEPSETPEIVLDTPTNITFSETTANIVIKWSTVEHADYYEVTVNTSPLTKIKSAGNSTSIPSSSLVSGTEYIVTVTAYANDEKKYGTSETARVRYYYNAITIELTPVRDIRDSVDGNSWKFSWYPVEHADYYLFTLEGQPQIRIDGTEYVLDASLAGLQNGSTYTIHVQACSEDTKYAPSQETVITRQYTRLSYSVTLVFKDESNNEVGRMTVNAEPGKYLLSALIQDAMPGGYELKEDLEIEVSSNLEKDVSVLTIHQDPEPTEEPVDE